MAVLTAAQIEYLRAITGDDCTPYDISDTFLQTLWDRSSDDECLTTVEILRVRLARASKLVNSSNASGQQRSSSQKFAQLNSLLREWEDRCGLSGGVLEMGTLDLRLDTDDEDEELS